MAGTLFFLPNARQLSIAGAILPGFKLKFFVSGTLTPTPVYANASLSTPLGTAVQADGAGQLQAIYLNPAILYRLQITDANDVLQPNGDVDPINVPAAEIGLIAAIDVSYDNTSSGLAAANVQDAIDELAAKTPSYADIPDIEYARHIWGEPSSGGSWGGYNASIIFDGTTSLTFTDSINPAGNLVQIGLGFKSSTNAAANTTAGARMISTNIQQPFVRTSGTAGVGGFKARFVFAFYDATKADQRVFIGYDSLLAAQTPTVDPSTYINTYYLGKDSADTNMQIMFNDGSGTATKTDTGITFASLANKKLQLDMEVPISGDAKFTLRDLGAGTVLGTWNTGTSNIPVVDTRFTMRCQVNSGPTATNCAIKLFRWDQFTDYHV